MIYLKWGIFRVRYWCYPCLLCMLLIVEYFDGVSSKCVMRGLCEKFDDDHYNYCYQNFTDPIPPLPKVKSALKAFCSEYLEMYDSFCCDEEQADLFKNAGQANFVILQSCPSCLKSFSSIYCAMNCHPNQSDFLRTEAGDHPVKLDKRSAKNVTYYLKRQFMEDIYQACKDTQVSGGGTAVEFLCGTPYCSLDEFVQTLGEREEAPFPIKFIFLEKPKQDIIPFQWKTYKCSEESSPGTGPCDCSQCAESCSVPEEVIKTEFMIWGTHGKNVIMAIFFAVGSIIIIVLICCYHRRRKRQEDQVGPWVIDNIKPNKFEKLASAMETEMEKGYGRLGLAVSSNPWKVLISGFAVALICACGLIFFRVTTDPLELWSNAESKTRLDKEYFDEHFGPFFRTEQIILYPNNKSNMMILDEDEWIEVGPIFRKDFLLEIFKLHNAIDDLTFFYNDTLKDVCFSPMASRNAEKQVEHCVIMSITGYFKDNVTKLNDKNYMSNLLKCIRKYMTPDCFSRWGGPIPPNVALGGLKNTKSNHDENPEYEKATAVILTYLVKNDEKALFWEKVLDDYLKQWADEIPKDLLEFSYRTERSLEDELRNAPMANLVTVLISNGLMFLYITVGLGNFTTRKRIFIDSKITLGIIGVVIVLISVACSVGIFGYAGVRAAIIIVEVIPFLVLAIGVDNIFILVHTLQRMQLQADENYEALMSRVLSRIGPSVTLTGISEVACFMFGAFSNTPAVRAFSLYAGVALIFVFLLQLTCFVALLTLDSKRTTANRCDVCCCIKCPTWRNPYEEPHPGIIYTCFKKYYAPALLHNYVRPVVILVFFASLCFSIACFHDIKVGLNEELAVPKGSYPYKYFQDLKKYLSTGPPVYFVVKESELNYSVKAYRDLFCGVGCDTESLVNRLSIAAAAKDSFITTPSSWIDDFFAWFDIADSDQNIYCCRSTELSKTFCPHTELDCEDCSSDHTEEEKDRDFSRYVPFFLEDIPDKTCPKAGRAMHGEGVKYERIGTDEEGYGIHKIGAHRYMSYHPTLKTAQDFTSAIEHAFKISEDAMNSVNKKLGELNVTDIRIEVFPYSIFYVYYEQYITIWQDAIYSLLVSFVTVFVVTFLLLGLDIANATIAFVTNFMMVANVAGYMYWWDIDLNPISLVNLVVAIGIGVEFTSHIVHSFATSTLRTREQRAEEALVTMGSSVLAGITITKFIGIVVLPFSQSQILQVYYFRMYLLIVLFGAAHGLIFLPVLLSYIGPAMNRAKLMKRLKKE